MDYSDELLFSAVVIVDVAVAHYETDAEAAARETDVVVAAVLAADNASPLPEVLWPAAAAAVVAAAVDAKSAVAPSEHDVEDAAELPQLHISVVVDNEPDFVGAVVAGALLHAGQPLLQQCWAGLSNFVAAAPYVPDDVQLQYYLVAYYYFAEALKSVAADEMIASTAIVAEYEYDAAAAVHEPPSADDGSSLPADAVVDVEMLMCSELQPCHSFDVPPPP